jgi:S1-C subfamily serine protease
VYAN